MTAAELLPDDADKAVLLGRVYDPDAQGPCVVTVDGTDVIDISDVWPTTSAACESADARAVVRAASTRTCRWAIADLLAATDRPTDRTLPRFLAPIDLHVVKAAGVTFIDSLMERVLEERTRGSRAGTDAVREVLTSSGGDVLTAVQPGSAAAEKAKAALIDAGLWSQYLEVAIGPDPEIFTKTAVLAAVGPGQAIGILQRSRWNNPEPEVVLVVRSDGLPVGATLGNDVNLRDFEGRSALLLSMAKDNNASCAVGPFIRLFDAEFDLDRVRNLDVTLHIEGVDGFTFIGQGSMTQISRDPLDLVRHTCGSHHQYPDGFVLFTGAQVIPTRDRGEARAGFTHHLGDVVHIRAPELGTLTNSVEYAETAPRWEFGISALIENLATRKLL